MKAAAIVLILGSLFIGSCKLRSGDKGDGNAIARVHNQYLYASDLKGLVPEGTSAKDSAEIVNTYVQNWIRQKLLLRQAENNLTASATDFQNEVEQYRNSLVIFQYESELVRQKLDTSVSQTEITDYYKNNQNNFRLHENIVRIDYIITDKNTPRLNQLRSLFQGSSAGNMRKLASLCEQYASGWSFEDTTWYTMNELSAKIPVPNAITSSVPAVNKILEFQDEDYHYLLKIKEFKSKESISPLELEVNNIRAIILNKRKTELLKKMEEDLMQQAIRNKYFEVYVAGSH